MTEEKRQLNKAAEITNIALSMVEDYNELEEAYNELKYRHSKTKSYDKGKDFLDRKDRLLEDLLRGRIRDYFEWNTFRHMITLDKDGNPVETKEEWIEGIKSVDPFMGLKVEYMTTEEFIYIARNILEEEYKMAVERAKNKAK